MQEATMQDCDGPSLFTKRRRDNMISSQRRKELLSLAVKLAEEVEEKTESYERCLLRNMVENLLGD